MERQSQTGGKNVVVLLSRNVTHRHGQVFMPNTIEMAQLKKPDKGQFVNNVVFTPEMTEEDVRNVLCSRLPILQNQRFCCASAVDNRTRLEFHGARQIWDGDFIRRTIRGNSALYILTEESTDLSQVSQSPAVEHSDHSTGTVSIADTRQLTSLQGSTITLVSYPSQQKRTGGKRKNDRSAEQRSLAQQGVPLSAKQKMGNNESHFLQTFKWGSNDLVQPMNQLAQQRHPSTTSTLTANPNNSTCSIQNVTSKQTSLNQLPRTLMTTVQHQDFPVTQTVTQSTVGPGQQTHETHGNLPTVFFAVSQQIATSSAVQQGDSNMQSSPQRGSAQFIVPAAVLQQNGIFNLNQDAVKDPDKLLQPKVPPVGSGVQLQPVNDTFDQDSGLESNTDDVVNVGQDTAGDTPSKIFNMSEEEFDNIIEDIRDVISKDSALSQSGVIKDIAPSTGSTEGGIHFYIIANQELPKEVLLFKAYFEGVGEVPLQVENPFSLKGVIPASYREGSVTVTVKSSNGTWFGCTKFTYINNNVQAILGEIVQVKKNQEDFFGALAEIFGVGSSDQMAVRSGARRTGSLSQNESSNAWSVKVLIPLVYKAAQIDGHEFLEMIFCTSAGRVVFNHYKNNAILPEDVARANGHVMMGYYLENVNKRFSNEGDSEDRNETIDWLELKHAVQKKHNLPWWMQFVVEAL